VTLAFDAVTVLAGSDPQEATHTPVGTPRAVVVLYVSQQLSADNVVGCTYGGVNVPRVRTDADTAGEVSRTHVFFLGSGIPTGAQLASIDKTTAESGVAVVVTYTAATDVEVIDHDGVAGDLANPSLSLQYGGREAVGLACGHSGGSNVVTMSWSNTGAVQLQQVDHGVHTSVISRQQTPTTSDSTTGWTAVSDDVCISAVVISEVAATPVERAAAIGATAAAATTFVPFKVSGLVTTPVSDTQIDLTWGEMIYQGGGYEYEVERDGTIIARVSEPEYSDTGLEPDTEYDYRVRAVRGPAP